VKPPSAGAELTALKGETRIEEPDRIQRAIARRTAESRATVPDLELYNDVEVGAARAAAHERGCSLDAVLVRACALALRANPRANAAYRDGRYELYSRVNVGVTIHSDGAYATPTVLDADTKSLEELGQELARLARRARAGDLTPPELAGATFTLTDHTARRVGRWGALVMPGQAAAIVAGAVRAAPVVRDDGLTPGQVVTLSLACDHRILFGSQAAAFLDDVSGRVERVQLS
jgi:pyruvate dehydrogenase E2 component (dihydrolipoamide acetyltransferase)